MPNVFLAPSTSTAPTPSPEEVAVQEFVATVNSALAALTATLNKDSPT